jgi:hypothetical protein
MISEQEEAMEAALLAGMVKSKMRTIDSMMESRPDVPADRINLHEFVRNAKQPQAVSQMSDQNYQVHSIPPIQNNQIQHNPPIHTQNVPNLYNDLEEDIKNVNINLEKINNNLTKLTGMFGKVFQNINKTSQK